MTLSATVVRTGFIVLGSLLLSGCLPSGTSQLDEEKEPHYLAGKRRFNEMDYQGAIEEYERASEVNPRSGVAHLELGCLLESGKGESDPVAAIYHFEQYVKLRPQADNAEIIKQHILACKQELARTVSLGPATEKQQREFEQITAENQRLREEVEKWRSYYAGHPLAVTNPGIAPAEPARTTAPASPLPQTASGGAAPRPTPTSRPLVSTRSHTIQPGETPSRIARKYGLKVEVLMAANPGLDPHRLQPGQALNIPAP